MIKSCHTGGFLVCDMSDRITTHDEAYAVTTCEKIGPVARSVYVIQKNESARGAAQTDDVVRYGQEIRIAVNPHIHNKPLYLNSTQISPLAFARFSRN